MGWRTDWLYLLIFRRIREVWNQATIGGKQPNERGQSSLERLVIEQCASVDRSLALCSEPIIRSWTYSGDDFQERLGYSSTTEDSGKKSAGIDKSHQGSVRFYISEDRKQIVFTHILGPHHGRGCVYKVIGQGTTAMLQIAPDTIGWVA